MKTVKMFGYAVAAFALVAVMVGGCSSDSTTKGVDVSGTARLTTADPFNPDGSRFKLVQFRATRSGYVRVTMERDGTSPVADPWVEAWYGRSDTYDEYTFIGLDDDSGGCWDAMLVFPVERNAWYTAMFTTRDPGDLGTYRYTIRELVCGVSAAEVTAPSDLPGKRAQ